MFTFCSVFLTRVARENTYNFVCFENEIPVERSLQCQALSFLTLLSQSVSGLAYCSNQKWQRMWKPRSFQPLVLVLRTGLCSHSGSWIQCKWGVGDIFSCNFGESVS